ncbi:hypothetical protein ACJX0J_021718, partial [Zea mays]
IVFIMIGSDTHRDCGSLDHFAPRIILCAYFFYKNYICSLEIRICFRGFGVFMGFWTSFFVLFLMWRCCDIFLVSIIWLQGIIAGNAYYIPFLLFIEELILDNPTRLHFFTMMPRVID